jgi:hypothetical protein
MLSISAYLNFFQSSATEWTACTSTTVQVTDMLYYVRFASQDTCYDLRLLPMTEQIMILPDQVRVPSEVPMGND